jgi:hypothetical protein
MAILVAASSVGGHLHWCPGCNETHRIPKSWTFNGSQDAPTFTPSVKHTWTYDNERSEHCCHYFIRDGNIEFCGDCTHEMAGKTVPLPDMPPDKIGLG